ncbi:MAG TPA: epoxyqueuosine reductase QueH [Syntrophales bacterium]|nr:epoxyqueuosine reductase QueH [Syntrophales bacterium]
MSAEYGIPFFYHDFREGWQEGIRLSKERAMYRQNYCGCIYSERERFCKD